MIDHTVVGLRCSSISPIIDRKHSQRLSLRNEFGPPWPGWRLPRYWHCMALIQGLIISGTEIST